MTTAGGTNGSTEPFNCRSIDASRRIDSSTVVPVRRAVDLNEVPRWNTSGVWSSI